MDEAVRWVNVTLSLTVALIGSWQWLYWSRMTTKARRMLMAVALLNLTALVGSWEQLRAGIPAGVRSWLLTVALVWLLAAVAEDPIERWRDRRDERQ